MANEKLKKELRVLCMRKLIAAKVHYKATGQNSKAALVDAEIKRRKDDTAEFLGR